MYVSYYIRHRAFRHRWSELMWKTIPDGHIFDLCRGPPPRFAYDRVHSHDFFRFFFLVSKHEAHWLQNGSPGVPQIYKKTLKIMSGRGSENNYKNNWKLEALDPQKQWFSIGEVAKITIFSLLQKRHQMSAKMRSKLANIYKMPLWMHCRKDNKK